jgi:AcrR family transcriptional regulator
MGEKKGYHHGDLRKALISAALEVIRAEGIRGLTLRKAARHAGVSHAAPAYHFGDLTGLLVALAEKGFDDLLHCMQAAVSAVPADDPLARFKAVGMAYVSFAAAEPASVKAMFHPMLADRSAYPSLEAASWRPFDLLLVHVRQCQDAGILQNMDDRIAALFAWSAVHGLSTLLIDGYTEEKGFKDGPDSLADDITNLIFAGLHA